jgi:hypothetical protein
MPCPLAHRHTKSGQPGVAKGFKNTYYSSAASGDVRPVHDLAAAFGGGVFVSPDDVAADDAALLFKERFAPARLFGGASKGEWLCDC